MFKDSIYSAENMFSYSWKDFEQKVSYMTIPESKRNFMEKSIPSLKQPFNVLKTLEEIYTSKF